MGLPSGWVARIRVLSPEGGPSGADWLAQGPPLIPECLDQWEVAHVGAAWAGQTATALPVERDGITLVVTVG